MDTRIPYEESVAKALRKIAAHVPEDLVQQFAAKSGIRRDDIHPIAPGPSGTVSAVDGSNAMVLDGGSVALAAIRAARTTFTGNERAGRAATPLTLVTIGPGHRNTDFDELFAECFGALPHKGLDNADPERASAILRDTLEYWVAQKTAADASRQVRSCSLTGRSGSPARTMSRCSRGSSDRSRNAGCSSPPWQNGPGQPGAGGTRSSRRSPGSWRSTGSPARGGRRSTRTSSTTPSTGRDGTGRSSWPRSTRR